MSFNTEKDLVDLFKSSYKKDNNMNDNSKILEEVSLGFGIADIVISELNDILNFSKREKLSSTDINIYQIIKKNYKITFEALYNITRANKIDISKSIKKLVQGCFIKEIDSYYIFSNKYELSFKKSIAFEAKLKNWKRALKQAYRYKWFADYSYVILDYSHSKSAIKNINEFKKLNIGLITISTKGDILIHYKPIKQKPIDPSMQILLSETIIYS